MRSTGLEETGNPTSRLYFTGLPHWGKEGIGGRQNSDISYEKGMGVGEKTEDENNIPGAQDISTL